MSVSSDNRFFSTRLENRCISIHDASDAARLSFIVQNSVSFLDLALTKVERVESFSGEFFSAVFYNRRPSKYSDDFINTEEKCRKIFTPNRNLLYTLHLDLPIGREYRMKNDLPAANFKEDFSIPHIAKITLSDSFGDLDLSDFVKEYLEVIDRNLKLIENSNESSSDNCSCFRQRQPRIAERRLKLLNFLLKSGLLNSEFNISLYHITINSFIECFYPHDSNSEIFRCIIDNRAIKTWAITCKNAQVLEYVLRQTNKFRIFLDCGGYSICDMINDCIFEENFLNIKPILMYKDYPVCSPSTYELYEYLVTSLRSDLTRVTIAGMETWMKPERIFLLLQMYWIIMYKNRGQFISFYRSPERLPSAAAKESLRLIWSAIPDPLISLEEIYLSFRRTLCVAEMSELHVFYDIIVGGSHFQVTPRKLTHLTRTTLRRVLYENGHFLPDGIRSIGLPRVLEEYLNLELEFDPVNKANCDQH